MSLYLIALAGLPGTGKSTVAKKLEERLNGFDLHSLLDVRRDMGHRMYSSGRRNAARELYMRVEASLIDGKSVIRDNIFGKKAARQEVYNLAEAYCVDVLIIECYCSEALAKRRMRERPSSDGLIVEPRNPKVYDKIAAGWDEIGQDFKDGVNPHVNYVRYNSENGRLQEVRVNQGIRPFVEEVKRIIMS